LTRSTNESRFLAAKLASQRSYRQAAALFHDLERELGQGHNLWISVEQQAARSRSSEIMIADAESVLIFVGRPEGYLDETLQVGQQAVGRQLRPYAQNFGPTSRGATWNR
jgi:hypothetical protein